MEMQTTELANPSRLGDREQAVLRRLAKIKLDDRRQGMLDASMVTCGGDPIWRGRKQAEAHDLLALSQIAPEDRLVVMPIDLRESLRAGLVIQVPVPCRPDANNRLRVLGIAMLGLTYRREAIHEHMPGWAFVQILDPHGVWLPAVDEAKQALCLGPSLPVGVRVAELVLLSYGALSMQTTQLDERDTAGVFNPEAALWWQQNADRIPLTRTPFLCADNSNFGTGRQA
jgi:hypothetical protein